MKKLGSLCLALTLVFTALAAFAAEGESPAPPGVSTSENLLDDCANFDQSIAHSDGIYCDVISEESQYAFAGDYTVFMRSDVTPEWVEYEIPAGGTLVFYTFFRQNEEVSHFRFEWSEDGETWTRAFPGAEQVSVESDHWIPVSYTCKGLPEEAKYIKIYFPEGGGVNWSPCIASVDCIYTLPEGGGFADCAGTPYAQATTLLKNLGLVNGYSAGEYKPFGEITRAEFAKMTASVLNLNVTYTAGQPQPFRDVESRHWAAGAVYTLAGLGILSGDEDRSFHPEDQITLQEAAKILVSALGYQTLAEEKGGYPTGYQFQASRLGVLDGLTDMAGEKALNRGDAALLFYNALDVEILYQTSFGQDSVYRYDGTTLLNKFHGIYQRTGVVTDAGPASIISESQLAKGQAGIGGEVYQSQYDMLPLLGQKVTAYAKYDRVSGDYTILYAYGSEAPVKVAYPDYLRLEENNLVYLGENGREVKRAVNANTRVVYNGRYLTRIGVADALPFSCGSMTLVNHNNDSAVDVILIEDYQTFAVTAPSRLDMPLTDRFQGAVNLRLADADEVAVTRYGESVEDPTGLMLQKGDVVQAAVSKDGKLARLEILNDYIIGAVSEVNDAEGTCVINGTEYCLSESFQQTGQKAETGSREVTAYFDINGSIALIDNAAAELAYGYLQSVADYDSFRQTVQVRLVTESGSVEVFEADTASRLNGAKNAVQQIAGLPPQLVRFRAGADGTLARLETAKDCIGTVAEDTFTRNYTSESCKYNSENTRVFASVYQLDASTKVFFVPQDPTDIREYEVSDYNSLYTDFSYKLDLYDLDRDYRTGAVVIYQNGSDLRKVSSYDAVAVVTSAGVSKDENGGNCLKITAYAGGGEVELLFDEDGAKDMTENWLPGYTPRETADGKNPFRTGEVFQYYTGKDGAVHSFRMLLTREMIGDSNFYEKNLGDYGALNEQNYYSELYSSFGIVTEKFGDKLLLCGNPASGWRRTIPFAGAQVYCYDPRSRQVREGDPSDIAAGDSVFVRMYYTNVKEIMVIGPE